MRAFVCEGYDYCCKFNAGTICKKKEKKTEIIYNKKKEYIL